MSGSVTKTKTKKKEEEDCGCNGQEKEKNARLCASPDRPSGRGVFRLEARNSRPTPPPPLSARSVGSPWMRVPSSVFFFFFVYLFSSPALHCLGIVGDATPSRRRKGKCGRVRRSQKCWRQSPLIFLNLDGLFPDFVAGGFRASEVSGRPCYLKNLWHARCCSGFEICDALGGGKSSR